MQRVCVLEVLADQRQRKASTTHAGRQGALDVKQAARAHASLQLLVSVIFSPLSMSQFPRATRACELSRAGTGSNVHSEVFAREIGQFPCLREARQKKKKKAGKARNLRFPGVTAHFEAIFAEKTLQNTGFPGQNDHRKDSKVQGLGYYALQ